MGPPSAIIALDWQRYDVIVGRLNPLRCAIRCCCAVSFVPPPSAIVNSVWTLESCWQMSEADQAKLSLLCWFCGGWIRKRNLWRTLRGKTLTSLLHNEETTSDFSFESNSFPAVSKAIITTHVSTIAGSVSILPLWLRLALPFYKGRNWGMGPSHHLP